LVAANMKLQILDPLLSLPDETVYHYRLIRPSA
jgi:hypothetical protein